MKTKGSVLLAILLGCWVSSRAATPQSSTDLWDITKGTVVTATSGTYDPSASLGMLGGTGYGPEPGSTVFAGGASQYVEFRTPSAVTVNQLRLFSRGDNDTSFRAFSKFTVKIKSPGSLSFDQTVYTWNPPVPFVILDTSSWLILDTTVTPFTAREFRAEFQSLDGVGSRVMEMDAFGSVAPTPPSIASGPTSTSVLAGRTASFSVSASGDAPLTYTWKHEGTNVVLNSRITSTGPALTIAGALPTDAGKYSVVVSNNIGQAESADATLTVTVPPPSSPTSQASDDLWDLSQGTVVTRVSPTYPESNGLGLLGGGGFDWEPESTVFSDQGTTNGFVHFAEWKTVTPVTISKVHLFSRGDGDVYSNGREMGRFTLKTKSSPSSGFDVTVFTYVPPHPYAFVDATTFLILETNLPPFTAQEFRGEFEQANLRAEGYNAPRVFELDGFGPGISGPPQVLFQPAPKDVVAGASASFQVGVAGTAPFAFQWRHAGTNLTESAKFVGVNSWSLTVKSASLDDAGDYAVYVTNSVGEATSNAAALTVHLDTTAPVVTITSPSAGSQTNGTFKLTGTVSDDNAVGSATWELNGHSMGALSLSAGAFSVSGQNFTVGDNVIKVTATDVSGNSAFATVTANWTVPRMISLDGNPSGQDGSRISVPVSLVSTGGVSGATFVITFNTNYLADPQFQWSDALSSAFTSVNINGKTNRATFALPGTALAAGSVQLGTMSFRARSVSTNTSTALTLAIEEVASDTGDPLTTGNYSHGSTLTVTKRKIIGDNNANDRLDVGDATVIMRFVSQLDTPRVWDTALNDINKSLSLDSGDVIKVLRAVVGVDPQPVVPAGMKSQDSGGGSGGVSVTFDKQMVKAGDKVTAEVRISDQTKPISGASFRLEYPVDALRLENSTANQIGPMAPATGALAAWNVAPNVTDYSTQNGAVSLGISSASAWATNNGTLARFTFTVQANAAGRYSWPVQVKNLEVSHDGFNTELLGGATMNFVARAANPASFSSNVGFGPNGAARLTLQGDLGATYVVHGSSDLTNWKVIGTYSTTTAGAITVDDADAVGASTRFYKATLVQ